MKCLGRGFVLKIRKLLFSEPGRKLKIALYMSMFEVGEQKDEGASGALESGPNQMRVEGVPHLSQSSGSHYA